MMQALVFTTTSDGLLVTGTSG